MKYYFNYIVIIINELLLIKYNIIYIINNIKESIAIIQITKQSWDLTSLPRETNTHHHILTKALRI